MCITRVRITKSYVLTVVRFFFYYIDVGSEKKMKNCLRVIEIQWNRKLYFHAVPYNFTSIQVCTDITCDIIIYLNKLKICIMLLIFVRNLTFFAIYFISNNFS